MVFWRRKPGWIGIDLGASSVKLAQVARQGASLRVLDAAIVRRAEPWSVENFSDAIPPSSCDEIAAALSLATRLQGKAAAAVLSMSACEAYQIRIPDGLPASPAVVGEQLAEQTTSHERNHVFDYWPTSFRSHDSSMEPESVAVLSMPDVASDRCADDVYQTGLSLQTLGAAPLALANAVSLSAPDEGATVVALDWGFASATFCAVRQGRPVYVRRLKNCGACRVVEQVASAVGISLSEAAALSAGQLGASEKSSLPSREIANLLAEFAGPAFQELAGEVRRTLRHVFGHAPGQAPREVVLFGGGSRIPGAAAWLGRALQMSVAPWRPDPSILDCGRVSEAQLPELAIAIAMSLSCWEGT